MGMDSFDRIFHEPIKVLKDPRLVALKNQRRQELREEFFKQKLSPYSYAKEAEGTIFDPAIQRYISTHAHLEDYGRTTPKHVFFFLGIVILPIVGLTFFFKTTKDKEELMIRTGQVPYSERYWKC